jgi:hypothetical protein
VLEFELKKIRIITLAFMGLSLHRTLNVVIGHFIYNGFSLINEEWFFLLLILLLHSLVIFNKKPALAALLLAIFYPKFESVFGVGNICTALFIYFCYFLAMWKYMANKYNLLAHENAETGVKVLNRLYWILFCSYAVLNFLSALMHLADPYWQQGYGMELVLSHTFWGRFYQAFRDLRHSHQDLANWLMAAINHGVLFSQLLLIPLFLFKPLRKWVSLWFIVLLVFIFILIRVTWLPHFTLLLFLLVFWRKTEQEYGLSLMKPLTGHDALKRYMFACYGLFAFLILVKTPELHKLTDKTLWFFREWDTRVWLNKRVTQLGLGQPSVLNADHVQGARRFLIYRETDKGKEVLPLLGKNGERLSYLPDPLLIQNQGLDHIYGNCMAHITAYDSFSYMNSPTPYKWKGRAVERLIRFDYFIKRKSGMEKYLVEFYERKYPNANGKVSWNYADSLTESRHYTFDGKELNRLLTH